MRRFSLLASTGPSPARPQPIRRLGLHLPVWLRVFVVTGLLGPGVAAQEARSPCEEEFTSRVKLAPFVVSGKSLEISIFARTRSDRRYGEEFSAGTIKVIYEAVTESTGRGLVIIGAKGEPHPTLVFRKFLSLEHAGKLDPAVAAHAPEVAAKLARWQQMLESAKSSPARQDEDDLGLDMERILVALPLPLEGTSAKLYQLAWEENFDDAKVEAKLRALQVADLESRDRFKAFDWIFYLPPKGAFDRVLDDIISAALKKEKMGFFARTAVKSVLLVIKPKIRRAIEAMRQGMMLRTVVDAQTTHSDEKVSALANAYVEVLMPFNEKAKELPGNNAHERAVHAVREQLRKIAEPPRPPDKPVSLHPLSTQREDARGAGGFSQ